MSYHGSSLALSPMTPSWQAWIKQEARTHLNVWQIFTSKTHPRPYFLHFVQHMSNCSTKKSTVIRTDNQSPETGLGTKKFTIPFFFFHFYSHQAISDGCLHLKNSRSLAEGCICSLYGMHREAALAAGTVGMLNGSLDFQCSEKGFTLHTDRPLIPTQGRIWENI